MRRTWHAPRLELLVSALLWLALLLAGLRAADRLSLGLDLGRRPWGEPTAAELEVLAGLQGSVRLTYFVSAPENLPNPMRAVPGEIERLLAGFEQRSNGHLRWRRFIADESDSSQKLAAERGVLPVRQRQILKDGWSETPVTSAIEIEVVGKPSLVLNGIGPEQLPRLPSLLIEHLKQLELPRPPRFGLSAPVAGYGALRAELARRGEVVELDQKALESGAFEGLDGLLLVDPEVLSEKSAQALLEARLRGRSLLIAVQTRRSAIGSLSGAPALMLTSSGIDPTPLLSGLGLEAPRWPLFDALCDRQTIAGRPLELPFLLRAIAPNQDFRSLGNQPNGTLLFPTPQPLLASGPKLEELGLEAQPLVTSSENSYTLDALADAGIGFAADGQPAVGAPIPLADVQRAFGRSLPKQALLMHITASDPWVGEAFVSSSPKPFADEFIADEGYAHQRLLQILLDNLTLPQHLVAARADLERAPRIGPTRPGQERTWRLITLGALPLLLLGLSLWRGAFQSLLRPVAWSRPLTRAAMGLLALLGVGALSAALPHRLGLDAASDPVLGLAPQLLELARGVANPHGELGFEWIQSSPGDLPIALRARHRDALNLLRELADRVPGASLSVTPADAGDAEQRRTLAARGIEPFPVESEEAGERRRREVFASLVIQVGDSQEQLDFPDARAFEDFAFRVGFACWRLSGNPAPILAFATDTPRLSPAEAHTEYLQRKLFAPVGTDVYSLARAALERLDFDVRHVDPALPRIPDGTAALFWLQPRRPNQPMLAAFSKHLAQGGKGLLASQHLLVQAQAHRGRGFETAFWPQPQFTDLEQGWLFDLGVAQPVEVCFDAQNFERSLVNYVNLDAERRALVKQDAALPFLVRVSSAYFAADRSLAGVGDQALGFPSPFELDRAKLAENGLEAEVLMTSSPAAWVYPWSGGFLPPKVLQGPSQPDTRRPLAPLYLRLTGRFPVAVSDTPGAATESPQITPGTGALLLLGDTELFKNEALADGRFRGDWLLAAAAADQCLPAELIELLGRRPAPRGLYFVAPAQRLRWRAGLLLAPLGLLGLLALGRRVQRSPR